MSNTKSMKILVTAASEHGSTKEIAEVIVDRLTSHGHLVTFKSPANVHSVDKYDAVIVGSAVYMTQWMEEARDFTKRFASRLREVPLWAFSVGLSGVLKGNVKDPSRVGPVLLSIEPIDHTTFAGRLSPAKLNLRERTIARLGGAIEGDYRDMETVRRWADSIAEYLAEHPMK